MPRSVGIKEESFMERKAPALAHDSPNEAPSAPDEPLLHDRESASSSTPFGYSGNQREAGMP